MSNSMSLENFARTLTNDIKASIEGEIKSVAEEALRSAINSTVYLQKKSYRPTYGFLNAVEIMDLKIGTKVATFRIGINASKMGVETRMPNEWNVHEGMKNQDFREGLIDTLDQGSSGSPYFNHAGYGFFDMAADDLDKSMIQAMASSLRNKGYKVEIY